MKKKLFRKLRELSNEVLGKEETNKIIEETIEETVKSFKKEIEIEKPKKETKKKEEK